MTKVKLKKMMMISALNYPRMKKDNNRILGVVGAGDAEDVDDEEADDDGLDVSSMV